MPKAKNPMTEAERSKRFEEEIKKRKEAGEFDIESADEALDAMVRKSIRDHGP